MFPELHVNLITPKQVAQRLQVSIAWVRDHSTRKHPRLPVVRIGGLLRFRTSDIESWLEEQVRLSARPPVRRSR